MAAFYPGSCIMNGYDVCYRLVTCGMKNAIMADVLYLYNKRLEPCLYVFRPRGIQNVKTKCAFKHLKEATVN